jgi:hypothetical protein
MFDDKELDATEKYCDRKIDDILNKDGGSDIDYIRSLQTLITLKNAAIQRNNSYNKRQRGKTRWKTP